jgi:hypothetical protein
MRKQMIENAAFELATQVRAVEDVIDSALAEMAELQSRLVRATGVTGIAHVRIQSAFDRLSATTNNLVAARSNIGSCHVALAEAKEFVPGLRAVSWGDGDSCPPTTGLADLRIVA